MLKHCGCEYCKSSAWRYGVKGWAPNDAVAKARFSFYDTFMLPPDSQPWQALLAQAAEQLARSDAVLAPVIERCGPCRIVPHGDYYQALVDAIISQQLSVKAAASIEKKFQGLFGGRFPTAEEILDKDPETLRSVGLSRAKATYVHDLALHIQDGRLLVEHLAELSNDAIIAKLTAIKGIGEWTAHMFLLFSLGRLDVLPVGDLGIRNGIQKLYRLSELPSSNDIQKIAADGGWHPYEGVASWYIWQSLGNKPIA